MKLKNPTTKHLINTKNYKATQNPGTKIKRSLLSWTASNATILFCSRNSLQDHMNQNLLATLISEN